MSFWNWFSRSKPAADNPELETLSQQEFDAAVLALAQPAEAEDMVAAMVKSGIKQAKAVELYLFVPVAFCRHFIPEAAYLDEYVEYYSERKQLRKSLKQNKLYAAIDQYTAQYFAGQPSRETVLSVAGLSSEFDAINQALHGGSQIKDLQFAPLYIAR